MTIYSMVEEIKLYYLDGDGFVLDEESHSRVYNTAYYDAAAARADLIHKLSSFWGKEQKRGCTFVEDCTLDNAKCNIQTGWRGRIKYKDNMGYLHVVEYIVKRITLK